METAKGTKGSSRFRIVESESESEVDDVNELSMSMKKVQLNDTSIQESDISLRDTDDDDTIENGKTPRKPPRGKIIQRLEDFSWSSSDDESDGSCSPPSSSNRKNNPIKTANRKSIASQSKKRSSTFFSSPTKTSTTLSSKPKASHVRAPPKTSAGGESLHVKLESPKSDISISDDSSFFSLDDGFSTMSTKSKEKSSKRKKNFSWSFNRKRREYTIGGSDKIPAFSIPSDLYDQLYDFQKDGVAWMASLHIPNIGGILGDDMGMGKTYTTLSFLGGLMRAKTIKKAIVVAPVSVMKNWENEAKKILTKCVGVKIQIISSDISVYKRKQRLHQALEAQSSQLVITSYGVVAKNPDHFTQHVVGKHVWDYVVLDEAHTIKNPATQNNEAVWTIAKSSKTRRLMLTGTPIMNNLKDLHTLFDFATTRKVLGSHKEFLNAFEKPIEAARSADAEDYEVERGESAMQQLQQLIQPYFLQRMKSEYLAEALPPKHEYVLWTNLSSLQRDLYTEYLQSEHVCSIVGGEAKSPIFAITWLQKVCGHPLLVEKESVKSIDNFGDHDSHELMKASAKLQVMYDLVDALVCKGHRILIFSQSTRVLDIIEQVLKEEFKLSRIDGQTKGKDRQKYVDEFNAPESDFDIMLISTKAGGQGLTLTGADSCIVYDPSWNPAEDAQAVDRCYRLGQKKGVQVYRLITAGTVEEKRYEKQIHKDGIRRTILTNTGNDTAKYFTKEELRKKVFILGEEGQCEFLDKLQRRGFSYDEKKNPDHSYSFLGGVIGQSSHDIVYSLPENFHFEETIKSPSQQPFTSPGAAATWITTNRKQTLMSSSQSKQIAKSPKQHPFSSPPTEAKWIGTNAKPMVITGSQSKNADFFDDNKENRGKNGESKVGSKDIVGEESNGKLCQDDDSQSSTSSGRRQDDDSQLSNSSGRKEHAVRLLKDILDGETVQMNETDTSKVHNLMAEIKTELNWLGK